MKKVIFILVTLLCASWAVAQPLPEFPALDSGDLASTSGLPDMPPVDRQPIAGNAPASLPDLPSPGGDPSLLSGSASSMSSPAGLPDLPATESAPVMTTSTSSALPDLPPMNAAPAVAPSTEFPGLPGLPGETVTAAAPALPPLPGEQPAAAPAPAVPAPEAAVAAPAPASPAPAVAADGAAPATDQSQAAPAVVKKAAKKVAKKPKSPWAVLPPRHPNTMFGGYVTPKGRGEEMHLAWSSQEILNAMLGNKYELLKEEGEYNPGGWREFTFQQIKTKRQVQVYVKAAGRNKVWMRVGPGEPPAGVTFKEATNVRKESEVALKILKKKFGKNFAPRQKTWEAPYDRPRS